MTLRPYAPEQLDQFALRLLDLAGVVREIANSAREFEIDALPVHDKKAREWCGKLEQWSRKCQADLEVRIRTLRATRRAKAAAE